MPIYEYTCKACGHETEILHKFSDPAPKKCPECGKPKLEKMVSAAGFRLAGGGWYETDFKSDGKKNIVQKEEAPAAAAPAASEASGAKGDSKPDSKADSKAESRADAKPEAKPTAKKADKAEKKKPQQATRA